jgi:hypothetical protein
MAQYPALDGLGGDAHTARLNALQSTLEVTTQVPGSQAMENGAPSKTAVMAASMARPCVLIVEREQRMTPQAVAPAA